MECPGAASSGWIANTTKLVGAVYFHSRVEAINLLTRELFYLLKDLNSVLLHNEECHHQGWSS